MFVACSEPYLESEYGADYASEAPVKLLDKWVAGGGRAHAWGVCMHALGAHARMGGRMHACMLLVARVMY